MKAIAIVFVILVINVSMSFVVHASKEIGVQGSYDNTIIESMENERKTTNIPLLSELEQLQATLSRLESLMGSLTFNWLWTYIPDGSEGIYKDAAGVVVTGLNSILGFFAIVAIIELWTKNKVI